MLHEIIGLESLSMNEAEAAGRPVLQSAQRLDVVPQQLGLVALRGVVPLFERDDRSVDDAFEHAICETVRLLELVPVEDRPAPASMKSAPSGTACAPNSLTKRTMRGIGGETRQVALVAVVPAEVEVAVAAVELGEVWHARRCARGAVGSAFSNDPLHPPVEDGLVPRRQLLAGDVRAADRCRLSPVDADRRPRRARCARTR